MGEAGFEPARIAPLDFTNTLLESIKFHLETNTLTARSSALLSACNGG